MKVKVLSRLRQLTWMERALDACLAATPRFRIPGVLPEEDPKAVARASAKAEREAEKAAARAGKEAERAEKRAEKAAAKPKKKKAKKGSDVEDSEPEEDHGAETDPEADAVPPRASPALATAIHRARSAAVAMSPAHRIEFLSLSLSVPPSPSLPAPTRRPGPPLSDGSRARRGRCRRDEQEAQGRQAQGARRLTALDDASRTRRPPLARPHAGRRHHLHVPVQLHAQGCHPRRDPSQILAFTVWPHR